MSIPPEYQCHRIDTVRREADAIVIRYSGRVFGGIVPELLAPGVAELLVPGAEIIVRLHTAETGEPNQVAHMLVRHPTEEWAELYEDM